MKKVSLDKQTQYFNEIEYKLRIIIKEGVRKHYNREYILKECEKVYLDYIEKRLGVFIDRNNDKLDYIFSFRQSCIRIMEEYIRSYFIALVILQNIMIKAKKENPNIENMFYKYTLIRIENTIKPEISVYDYNPIKDREIRKVIDMVLKYIVKDRNDVIEKIEEMKENLRSSAKIDLKTSEKTIEGKERRSLNLLYKLQLDINYHNQLLMVNNAITKGEYYWTSAHIDASNRCRPWQGKLFDVIAPSINDRFETGEIKDGNIVYSFRDVINQVDEYGYRNNIIVGFNCRHFLIKYQEGDKPPKAEKSALENKIVYAKANYYEDKIRQMKNMMYMYPDNELAKEVKEEEKMYIEYCKKNKIEPRLYKIDL